MNIRMTKGFINSFCDTNGTYVRSVFRMERDVLRHSLMLIWNHLSQVDEILLW